MIADTYNPTSTIAAQQAAREAAVVAEDSYYKDAGQIERPLPDNWPWPSVKKTFMADDTADKALEARVTAAEGEIDEAQEDIATNTSTISSQGTRLTTAEGEIDTLQSEQSSLDSRVTALETPAAG